MEVCTPADHTGDTETLIALHSAWGQPGWDNWLSRESIADWRGVSVDSNGRVGALSLFRAGVAGEFPEELVSLSSLRLLDLRNNRLTGEVPRSWADSGTCVFCTLRTIS